MLQKIKEILVWNTSTSQETKMKLFKFIQIMFLVLISLFSGFAFSGSSTNYSVVTNFNSVTGSTNMTNSLVVGTGYSNNFFVRLGSQSYNVTHLLTKPEITIISPVNNSIVNVSSRGVQFIANFTKEIKTVIYTNENKTINLTKFISNNEINTTVPINYGQNILEFTIRDIYGVLNTYTFYVNTSFQLEGTTENDIDGDGLNNSDDKVFGNTSHIYTNIQNFTLKINNTENLSQVFNQTINVTFYRNDSKLIEFQNNFTNRTINLTSLIVKDDRVENSSKVLISGLDLEEYNTKTIYLDLLGNTSKYSSLCIKDAEIVDFVDISDNCNGTNETYIVTIPSSLGQYTINYTNSSNTTVKIEGLTHSGINQVCTESWTYSSWSTCSGGSQSRTASDANSCSTTNTRDVLTQSCTSSSGGGGGGGGSSLANKNNIVVQTITTSNSNTISNVVKPTEVFQSKYEISVDSKINLNESFSGVKTVKIKSKNSFENIVEFDFDFSSNSLNLTDANIEIGNNGKSYTIVKGIDLKTETKKVKLKIVTNSNTICIKDAEVNSIGEVSSSCNGLNEYIIECDGIVKNQGYSCNKENGYYIVSGLKHSAVLEFEKSALANTTPVEILPQNTQNKAVEEEILEDTQIESNSIPMNYKYISIGVLILIIMLILILIMKHKHKKKEEKKEIAPPLSKPDYMLYIDSYRINYKNVEDYVRVYRHHYSQEDLVKALRNAGYPEIIIEEVIDKEYEE